MSGNESFAGESGFTILVPPSGPFKILKVRHQADEPGRPSSRRQDHARRLFDETIPPELQASREAMEESASAFARERRWRVWLVLSKRTRIWFNERGESTGVTDDTFKESFGPYMQIGNKRFVLGLLNGSAVVRTGTTILRKRRERSRKAFSPGGNTQRCNVGTACCRYGWRNGDRSRSAHNNDSRGVITRFGKTPCRSSRGTSPLSVPTFPIRSKLTLGACFSLCVVSGIKTKLVAYDPKVATINHPSRTCTLLSSPSYTSLPIRSQVTFGTCFSCAGTDCSQANRGTVRAPSCNPCPTYKRARIADHPDANHVFDRPPMSIGRHDGSAPDLPFPRVGNLLKLRGDD